MMWSLLLALSAKAVLASLPCSIPSDVPCCNPFVTDQLCAGGFPCEPCGGSSACQCGWQIIPPPVEVPSKNHRLTIVNGCPTAPMWIAHIVAGVVGPDPQDVKILSGEKWQFTTGKNGSGLAATRFWPKLGCDDGGNNCEVGRSGGPAESCVKRVKGQPDDYSACAPPVDTKFEATFAEPGSTVEDCVDMSLVDGYSVPFKIEVSGGSCTRHLKPFLGMDCSGLSMEHCPSSEVLNGETVNLNAIDPKTGKQGGCYSPCMRLTDDKWNGATGMAPDSSAAGPYCCAGEWGNPDSCKGHKNGILKTEYLKTVRALCPAAYGYAYDDRTSTISCTSSTEYEVTFYCPSEAMAALATDTIMM